MKDNSSPQLLHILPTLLFGEIHTHSTNRKVVQKLLPYLKEMGYRLCFEYDYKSSLEDTIKSVKKGILIAEENKKKFGDLKEHLLKQGVSYEQAIKPFLQNPEQLELQIKKTFPSFNQAKTEEWCQKFIDAENSLKILEADTILLEILTFAQKEGM